MEALTVVVYVVIAKHNVYIFTTPVLYIEVRESRTVRDKLIFLVPLT
jgi:hypothetical protein